MVSKLTAEFNKIYFINKYTLIHILDGSGGIQVDFKIYHNWKDKIFFLEKGQHIKFLSENFTIRKIEFEDEIIFRNKDVRVLFKHLLALGYINFSDCKTCQKYLSNTVLSDQVGDIVDISSKQWFWQNPFHANKEEYHVIFDIKEIIDTKFHNHLSNDKISQLINHRGLDSQSLFKSKIGLSVKSMMNRKRLLESKKEIAFSNKSIKEIAYELGFKDPAYFNRTFKKSSGKSPNQFREEFNFESRDLFVQDIYDLLNKYHQQERSVDFYAKEMHLSIKTLSKKVKEKLNISMGQLIRLEIINTAKTLLNHDLNVNEIAYQLGFEEANHFSAFFKHHTGITPSSFKNKKYNS